MIPIYKKLLFNDTDIDTVTNIVISKNGRLIVGNGIKCDRLLIWTYPFDSEANIIKLESNIKDIKVSNDGSYIILVCYDTLLFLSQYGSILYRNNNIDPSIENICISGNDKVVAISYSNRVIKIFDVTCYEYKQEINIPQDDSIYEYPRNITLFSIYPSLIGLNTDGTVLIWSNYHQNRFVYMDLKTMNMKIQYIPILVSGGIVKFLYTDNKILVITRCADIVMYDDKNDNNTDDDCILKGMTCKIANVVGNYIGISKDKHTILIRDNCSFTLWDFDKKSKIDEITQKCCSVSTCDDLKTIAYCNENNAGIILL